MKPKHHPNTLINAIKYLLILNIPLQNIHETRIEQLTRCVEHRRVSVAVDLKVSERLRMNMLWNYLNIAVEMFHHSHDQHRNINESRRQCHSEDLSRLKILYFLLHSASPCRANCSSIVRAVENIHRERQLERHVVHMIPSEYGSVWMKSLQKPSRHSSSL